MQTADSIADLYRENTQGSEPSDEQIEQLLATLEPGEDVLFTCGWPDMSEKWGPLAQLTVTTRRILDQRWAGPGTNAPVDEVALADILAVTDRQRGGERHLFETRALVVALIDGTTLTWEHLTNHQVTPAAEAIERAREEP
jgi:hypothetical protein